MLYNRFVMRYLLTVSIFILMSTFVCLVSKRKFGHCLPVTMLGTALLLYICRFMFGTFSVAYYISYVIAILTVPAFILRYRRDGRETIRDIITPGFWCFIIIILWIYLYDYGRTFVEWDDRSHWGLMVKEMLRLDDWYFAKESRLLAHKDYPPFASLFEMFWCHILGQYHESGVLHGIHVLELSLIAPPVVDGFKKFDDKTGYIKRIMGCFAAVVCTVYVTGIFDIAKLFRTAYTDTVLSCIFIFGMYLVIEGRVFENGFDLVGLIICVSALLLTKQVGIAFALLIWLSLVLHIMMCQKNGRQIVPVFLKGGLSVVIPVLLKALWTHAVSKEGITGQFSLSQISFGIIAEILKDNGAYTIQRKTLNEFVRALFLRNITSLDVTVTYVSASIILLIILIALYRSFYDINRKRKARIQIWTFVCGTLGYALTLCVLYLFCFSESEMAVLASYERYTGCYVMAEFFILVIFIIRSVDIKKLMQEKKIGFIAGTLFMLLISGSTFKIFIPAIVEPDSNGEYVEAALALDKYAGDEEVFILSEDTLLSQLYIN